MPKPVLLVDRPTGVGIVVAVVVPVLFGAVTGIMLGVSEAVYLLLSLLGIAGGFFAGLEHDDPVEGFYRGLLGGLLFGSSILLANGLADKVPKAELPDPATLLIVITAVAGALLGFLGGRSRAKGSRPAAGQPA